MKNVGMKNVGVENVGVKQIGLENDNRENEKTMAGVPASPHWGRHAAKTVMALGWRKHAIIDYSCVHGCFRSLTLYNRTRMEASAFEFRYRLDPRDP